MSQIKNLVKLTLLEYVNTQKKYNSFPLNSLVKFAKKFDDFKQFSKWYSIGLNHGYYWHLTDNKDFQISDKISPRDMSSLSSGYDTENYGDLMVTGDLEYWDDYYNMNPRSQKKDIKRNYVALFDASDLDPKVLTQVSRGFGNEIYLYKSDTKKLKLIGVYSRDYAKRLNNKFHKMIPQSENELYDLWKFANKKEKLNEYYISNFEDAKDKIIKEESEYNKFLNQIKQTKTNFINSIKTFDDLDDNKIHECLDYFGYEGFNYEEDGFDYLKDKIEDYKQMPDPVILYRVIGVKNKKMIKNNSLGEHYTPYKWNINGDTLLSIGYENWDADVKPYVMEVSVPHSEIDIIRTIINNLSFPNEHEITLKNNGKGAKFIKAYKLKGF